MGVSALISACDACRAKVIISACGTGGAKALAARAGARTLRKGDGASMRIWE